MSGSADRLWKPGLGVSASGAEEWVSPTTTELSEARAGCGRRATSCICAGLGLLVVMAGLSRTQT